MPTDRVLIELVTAANMAGVEQAQAGFLKMNASTLALGAALGGLIFIGKAAIENTEKQTKAHLDLQQAAAASKENFKALQSAFDDWSEANKRYIPDQYAAEQVLASFVRAGAPAATALRELGIALDLATIKGEDMGTAQQMITLALAGNARGLKTLGITTEEYNAIMKDKHLPLAQKQAELLALIETRTKDGRKAQTDLKQSTQALNHDWEDMTTKVGPPLLSLLTYLGDQADRFVSYLDKLGKDKDWNRNVSKGLGEIQGPLIAIVKGFEQLSGFLDNFNPNKAGLALRQAIQTGGGGYHPGKAAGGPVSAGMTYLVGERGPELFTPGTSGGITPHGAGGTTINVNIHGSVLSGADLDRFFNEGLRRARFAPGT